MPNSSVLTLFYTLTGEISSHYINFFKLFYTLTGEIPCHYMNFLKT